MEHIEWEKAPEGATHAGLETGSHWAGFYKVANNAVTHFCANGERRWMVATTGVPPVSELIERPPGWNGSSLPPVGLKVEAHFHADTNPDWLPFTLKYFSEENVVFRGPIVETHMSRCAFDKYGFKYRAIRTPEQIVAEEREHKIRNACTAIARTLDYLKGDIPGGAVARQVVEAMIDAGYAKQVQS